MKEPYNKNCQLLIALKYEKKCGKLKIKSKRSKLNYDRDLNKDINILKIKNAFIKK